jgi:ABC-type nitrate/sulfonate/bicarbonate transport system substrate-binding protein
MKSLSIALDWTPNVNHIGFFIAREKGFFTQRGLDVQIIDPLKDQYKQTPAKKLELGIVDFAIAPFESVISYRTKKNPKNVIAVYAILQEDLSSIVTLESSGIDCPRKMDNTTYASYQARYEDKIVQQMMLNDGGKGELNIIYPEKLGIWNTLLENKADATWIFNNWEGIEADQKNINLYKFTLKSYGIPYGYSPVILADEKAIIEEKESYSQFIAATKEGFLYASKNIDEAAEILQPSLTEYDRKNIDVKQALIYSAPFFGNASDCGKMDEVRVNKFVQWLIDNELEQPHLLNMKLFTNELNINATQ